MTTAYPSQPYVGLGLQHTQQPQQYPYQQEHPQPRNPQYQPQAAQPSTKALAITSRATKGVAPPPLMGAAVVLVNDSAMHCFGGRLQNRDLTNCHYVLDVETGSWETIHAAPTESQDGASPAKASGPPMLSLSLTTDPVNTNSGSLSDSLSIPPRPRYFHTLNAYGTSLILFGGMAALQPGQDNEDSDNEGGPVKGPLAAMDDLHVFDIITQRWQQKFPTQNEHTPRARWAHMATILDHYLVVIGGTDTAKAYVEDACVLDLHTWEWVASVQSIGQCGSYRTVAATGPSVQAPGPAGPQPLSSSSVPSSPSFPSADAFTPQISSNLAWPSTDSGPIDAMASISQVLSGRISTPSSAASFRSMANQDEDATDPQTRRKKNSERLMSGELTPAFKAGTEGPSIYLYSNYNFQNLQRELKVITPHYQHGAKSGSPSFAIAEKSQALTRMGHDLPPGLRFPQGHVYQDQLILTGTLIVPGKAPTLAIYAFNLNLFRWERLCTDTTLESGSWSRTLLHPATGTLLIFGNRDSNAEADYSNRIQHHDHIMMINLQAYGLYERPIPSFPTSAQDLGHDLLNVPALNDMVIASASGTLFDANSTILAARWPEFATMLLSPPYLTPLIMTLPVPDEVVPLFLQYLYTGALPSPSMVSPGAADYLLILARRYQLNGLYALTIDILHQSVNDNPIRIYNSALMSGELGLQARAVGLAMTAQPKSRTPSLVQSPNMLSGMDASIMSPSMGSSLSMGQRRPSIQVQGPDVVGLSRNYSSRVPPPPSRPPFPPERRRAASSHSRDSMSTDGGMVGETLLQQYTPAPMSQSRMAPKARSIHENEQTLYLSSPEPGALPSSSSRQRKMRSPPVPPNHHASFSQHPMSFMSSSSGGSNYATPLPSPGLPQSMLYQQQQSQQSYTSPLSPSYHQQPYGSQHNQGYMTPMRGSGSDGAPSIYGMDDQDDGSSIYSGQGRDMRSQQAKRRLQMQMQMQMELDQQQQQQILVEQQQMRDHELMMAEQYRATQQRYLAAQQAASTGGSDYHYKNKGSPVYPSSPMPSEAPRRAESTVETISSHKSGSSKASIKSSKSDKEKKSILGKMKPPKPKASGADLMKSAGF